MEKINQMFITPEEAANMNLLRNTTSPEGLEELTIRLLILPPSIPEPPLKPRSLLLKSNSEIPRYTPPHYPPSFM